MVTRLQITLEQDEYKALLTLAAEELRNPADQLRVILRHELEERSLLPSGIGYEANEALHIQGPSNEKKRRN